METNTATQTTWAIDAAHSSVLFHVDHMMISEVSGKFSDFAATLHATREDLSDVSGTVTIQAASINTENGQRDGHLRSADFFDADTHPTITYQIQRLERSGNDVTVDGQLTIRGTTLPVQLKGTFKGTGKDPWGGTRAAFKLHGRINRKDYGLKWNQGLELGGVLVGEEVRIDIHAQLVQQA